MTYTALVYEDPETPGTWIAEFPAIPEAHSFGRTPEEALVHAKEALELVLAYLKETGRPLPPDVRTVQVGVDAA
ncbi:HicB family protein [Thermus scotoductus]|uniref:HicB family protein n=1 Tax=Thermus scotoductus TaxID=37636 RepID=A0A430VQ95_THESC|nr:type II toxin-antitoxin system HicB family antitoxin [Thermus scotoductus]RTI55055.1 HicB family protein [Thermus scotoductus]